MPAYDYAPRFALSARFDAREWAAATALITRNGTTASATAGSAIIHGDAVDFLNGRGSDLSAAHALDAQAAVGGWTVEITSDDKVRIYAPAALFRVANTAANRDVFGFTQTLPTAAAQEHIADGDWLRGNQSDLLTLTNSSGAATWSAPEPPGTIEISYQSIPVMFRERGAAVDADDVTGDGCLEQLEQAAHGNSIRWGIDAEGHAWWEADGALFGSAAAATPTWNATTLRDRLGFTGDETTQDLTGTRGVYRGEAANPLPGLIVPTRPAQRLDVGAQQVGDSVRTIGGARYFVGVATHRTWALDWHLDGPADSVDLSQHWLTRCVPYFYEGAPVTLYQDWGDTRRAGLTLDGDEYGLLYTVEQEPYRGRLILQLSQAAGSRLSWPGPMRRRVPLTLRMEEPRG